MGRALSALSLAFVALACGGESVETAGAGSGGTSGSGVSSGGGGSGGGDSGGGGSGGGMSAGGAAGKASEPPPCDKYYDCCNRDNGHLEVTDCDANGNHLPCTGNSFHRTTEPACMPDDVEVDDCAKLDGLTCRAGQECHNFAHCSSSCTCEAMGGGYRYRCSELLC